MLKFISLNKEFIIGLLLTFALFWPLLAAPYFTHHDDVQVIRLYEMDKCIKDHQIPCRWVPDLGGLYGYPIFNFYAPLPYYFSELIYLLTNNLLFSAKMMFAVSFLGAYVFMFLLGKKLWGSKGGVISALFYTFAPYHAADFYVRGAMGEMWGLMFFPAIFWSLLRLEEKINIPRFLLLAVFIFALIISHNLSAMIFLPLVIVWTVILFLKKKNIKYLWFCLAGLILGIALSAFYFFPALLEKNLVHLETTVEGYFSYTEHFKGLKKLFIDRSFGYGASVREVPGGERDGLSFQIGIIQLIGWLMALISVKFFWNKNRNLSYVIIFSSAVILSSVFMIHPRSEFVWKLIDPLKYLQFPWRFLMLITFFISLIAGSFYASNCKYKNQIWVILIFAVVLFNFSYFRPANFLQTNDKARLSGKDWDTQIKRSIFDYLPIYAKEPPAELAKTRYEILTGDSRVYDFKEGSSWISFRTKTGSHTIIRLSQYYFPNWKVFVDNQEVQVEYKNNSLGLMTFILGKGDHTVHARFYDTQIRTLSNLISLIGFTASIILLLVSFPKFRSWISYYRKRMN